MRELMALRTALMLGPPSRYQTFHRSCLWWPLTALSLAVPIKGDDGSHVALRLPVAGMLSCVHRLSDQLVAASDQRALTVCRRVRLILSTVHFVA